MSQTTPLLDLPLIQEAQAQKHVTHNEAVAALDALVLPVALDADRTAPPAAPAEGDRHLVAAPATGVWAGRDGTLAAFSNGGWVFHLPRAGWRVQVLAEAAERIFDGAVWARPAMLGLNATADATNRLTVAAPATLLSHEGAGHQIKVNKAAPSDTASLLFQTGFSGRAEMGLAGSDDFAVKVSADGATFHDGLAIAAATGAVRLPGGYAGTGSAAGPLGGQIVTVTGAHQSGLTVGNLLSIGNGSLSVVGPAMPFAGRVLGASVSVAGGAGTTELQVALDGVAQPGFALSVAYPGSGVATATADFSGAPLPVGQGVAVNLICTQGGTADHVTGAVFVQID
ncbi:DUF2793 domain-containing protein [Jannaschia seohaensis]|uniref:Uncharacterized protein DUF2793 n=1 Tax=Jannaschia seohaensis TaxID=475081 RepID=A0A2Y9B2H9_9RHOB|nr:DUF2793 domain-containing protein [Jannaschia seohaensis]PWJ12926.1 uncharacterized protein DUF2793 [Jannaschia seohaensis]SSA50734.1 Protein of unknown function [Jannaschia seohaensis]